MMNIRKHLLEHRLVPEHHVDCKGCLYDIENCGELKLCIQQLISQWAIHICGRSNKEEVAMLEIPYPTICLQITVNPITPLVICAPAPFLYESTKVLSWRYDPVVYIQGQEKKGNHL